VKGMRAAAGITRDGGTVIPRGGVRGRAAGTRPLRGPARDLGRPAEFLARLATGEIRERDQWQVQVQAAIQTRVRVWLTRRACRTPTSGGPGSSPFRTSATRSVRHWPWPVRTPVRRSSRRPQTIAYVA
jgi:hypothetical protein